MDLSELVKDLKPNIITPHMEEVIKANPAARANVIARYILRGMVKQRGKIDPIDIIHNGEVQTVRFLCVKAHGLFIPCYYSMFLMENNQ